MVTSSVNSAKPVFEQEESRLTIQEAIRVLSREERFMATVAAMNTLLVSKGIYKQAEFDEIFCDWAEAQLAKPRSGRVGKTS